MALTVIELCAGAGGQAIGLERAGFEHVAAIEIDGDACRTLALNRPDWRVFQEDLNLFSARKFVDVDLVAGGLPCPPFSKAGKQLGELDERNLFPAGLRIIAEVQPRAVMLENVKGFLDPRFAPYRAQLVGHLQSLGYVTKWRLLNASDFGVPQLRPRVVLVALRPEFAEAFDWPEPCRGAPSVGETLYPLMASRGWSGARKWADQARSIAPTLVGGSKKHGGPDLGPTRARLAWAQLGVDGQSLANEPPAADFDGRPRLTVEMAALLQGFPHDWKFFGRKTTAYRQVGNAFPPPVACAVARQIYRALERAATERAA